MADEFEIHVPKSTSKKYNVMRFGAGDQVNIKKWVEAQLSRDLSAKKQYEDVVEYPEFGEGSEYGKRRREEARRLKYGVKKSKFIVENQPWDLTIKTLETPKEDKKDLKPKIVTKEFHGKKEGGIGEGSVYFVLTQRPNHSFEAYPVQDWCNFSRKISHRTLTVEEADAAWDKRDKIRNHLNYMARKRLNIDDEDDEEALAAGGSSSRKVKKEKEKNTLQIHDHEDVGLMSDSDEGDDNETSSSKNKKPDKKKSKKDKVDAEEVLEAVEDSDDGENEAKEIAYDSDVSSENEEFEDSRVAPKGLDELNDESSSSEDEDDEGKKDVKGDKNKMAIAGADGIKQEEDSDSDELDEDIDETKSSLLLQSKKISSASSAASDKKVSPINKNLTATGSSGRSSPLPTLSGKKRGLETTPTKNGDAKRSKLAMTQIGGSLMSRGDNGSSSSSSSGGSSTVISVEAVKRILMHKPITIPKLLKKFRSSGIPKQDTCNTITEILRTMKLNKIKINGKMHLYLKN